MFHDLYWYGSKAVEDEASRRLVSLLRSFYLWMIVRCVLTVCPLIYVQSSERSVESGRGHHHDRGVPSLLSSQHCADATAADGAEQAAHNRDGHRLLGENVEPNTGTEEGKIRDTAGTFGAGNKAFICTLSSTIIICACMLLSLYILQPSLSVLRSRKTVHCSITCCSTARTTEVYVSACRSCWTKPSIPCCLLQATTTTSSLPLRYRTCPFSSNHTMERARNCFRLFTRRSERQVPLPLPRASSVPAAPVVLRPTLRLLCPPVINLIAMQLQHVM